MKPSPPGWPRISASVFYDEPAAAIDWLCKAFGFEVRLKIEGEPGQVVHSELELGEDGLIMVGDAKKTDSEAFRRSPRSAGGCTQALFIYVDDIDAHFARAKAAGAKVLREPTVTDYGEEYWSDRGYECVDPEGHHWWFSQRIKTGKG